MRDKTHSSSETELFDWKSHVISFETDNSRLLSDRLQKDIGPEVELKEFQLNENMWNEPYFPFLNIIRDSLCDREDKDISRLLTSNVYPAHNDLFLSFIKNLPLFRNEEIIMEELEYEKSQMTRGIVNLMAAITESAPLFLHLMNFECASQSLIIILRNIISECNTSNLFIFCSSAERAHFSRVMEYSLVKSFFRSVKIDSTEVNFEIPLRIQLEEQSFSFTAKLKFIDSYFFFIDMDECRLRSQQLYNQFVEHNMQLDRNDHFSLLKITGDTHLLIGDLNRALIVYFSLLDFSQKEDDLIFLTESYKRISITHLLKNDPEEAVKYGILCDKSAHKTGSEQYMAQSAFLLFQLQRFKAAYAKKYFSLCLEKYLDLFKLLEKVHQFNTLAYLYTNGSLILSLVKSGSETEASLKYLRIGIELSEKVKNYFRISEAYYSEGIYHQATGNRIQALKYYKKALKLKNKINNDSELSKINNGMGYFYFSEGDYKSSAAHYNKSMKHLMNSKHYKEICGTLFNFASINFFTFNNHKAIKYYKYMLRIMNPLDIVDLPYHSRVTIYSLLAICHLNTNNIQISLDLYSQIKHLPDFHETDQDFEYFALFEAMLEKYRGNYELSESQFLKALDIQVSKNVEETYFLIRVYYELGCLHSDYEKGDLAVKQWKSALNLCSGEHFPFMRTFLQDMIDNGSSTAKISPFKARNFNIHTILELVDLDTNINELHKRVGEISFLNNLQDILRESESENNKGIIYYSLNLIYNSFLIDTLIFAVEEDDRWSLIDTMTSSENLDLADPDKLINNVIHFADRGKSHPFESVAHICVQSSPLRKYILICGNIGIDKPIDKDDFKVLTIAAKQMVTAVEKINQEIQILQKNINLEQKVKERTLELERSLEMIKSQREEIQEHYNQLEEVVKLRTEELLESEKLASLGGLVANLAHEINTPLGNIITTNSFLKDQLITFKDLFGSGQLKKSDLLDYLDTNKESTSIIEINSKRVRNLIDSFKQLSIDQAVLDKISFNVRNYIDHIILVLKPTMDIYFHQVIIECDPHLKLNSYPGLFSQILTNLLLNSIIHGFTEDQYGIIKIVVMKGDEKLSLIYSDDGAGMDEDTRNKIYQPFFTTKRNQGGTGLGLHIVYNIVTQNLKGTITCKSEVGKGTRFYIELPF